MKITIANKWLISYLNIAGKLTGINTQLPDLVPLIALSQEVATRCRQLADKQVNIEVVNQSVLGVEKVMQTLAELFEASFFACFSAMEHKIKREHDTWPLC
jgi:hypothetical protein